MATYDANQIIYARDKNFENLRQAFKNELDRRSHWASAEAPNGHYKKYSTFNTARTEAKDEKITTTYADILNGIQTNIFAATANLKSNYTTGDKIPALTNLYSIINNLASGNNNNTGCNASCVGFCSGSCYGQCNGCSSYAETNAVSGPKKDSEHQCGNGSFYGKTGCGATYGNNGTPGTCQDCGGCDSVCGSNCSQDCDVYCYGNCGSSCNGTCTNGCRTSCTGGCSGGCSSSCSGSCLGRAHVTDYADWQ